MSALSTPAGPRPERRTLPGFEDSFRVPSSSPGKIPFLLAVVANFPSSGRWQPPSALLLWICQFWTRRMSGVKQCVAFYVCGSLHLAYPALPSF